MMQRKCSDCGAPLPHRTIIAVDKYETVRQMKCELCKSKRRAHARLAKRKAMRP